MTVCIALVAPRMASTGQAWMHLVQPMHVFVNEGHLLDGDCRVFTAVQRLGLDPIRSAILQAWWRRHRARTC